ncbi:uncharacterized protein [Magallana gigas]|uniref:uncharacterized protein isoform X1 n=1 Tax=Magallana gigas TaxID=29159 RepID=UPI003341FBBD
MLELDKMAASPFLYSTQDADKNYNKSSPHASRGCFQTGLCLILHRGSRTGKSELHKLFIRDGFITGLCKLDHTYEEISRRMGIEGRIRGFYFVYSGIAEVFAAGKSWSSEELKIGIM